LASDVQQAGFVADLGEAFMDDWVFLAGRVVGNNEKD